MKVMMLRSRICALEFKGNPRSLEKGKQYDLDERLARQLIRQGFAEEVKKKEAPKKGSEKT
jgi:hypothetical protein